MRKLSELSDQLPAELFFLPHKSYAVNLSYVTRIDTSLKCFVWLLPDAGPFAVLYVIFQTYVELAGANVFGT